MKQFTTPEHIKPIVKEILSKYQIKKPAADICDFILESKTSRDAYLYRNGSPAHYIPDIDTLKNLYADIDNFIEAVETYPGELYDYGKDQKRIVLNLIRTCLFYTLSQEKPSY